MKALNSLKPAPANSSSLDGHLPIKQNRVRFYDTHEARTIVKLAAPIALVSMVNMAMSITDTIMVASLGPSAITSVAVSSDFYSILFYFLTGLLTGLSPAYAEAWNFKNMEKLANLRTAGWALIAMIAIPSVAIIWFAPDYLRWVGIGADVLEEGRGYTRALAITLLPMLVVAYFRNRLTAIERPNNILKITLAAVPINAALNWIFIFGIGNWTGLGVTGAGVSSLISTSLIAVGLMWLARKEGDFGMSRTLDVAELLSAIRIGFPIGIAILAEVGVFLAATLFVAAIAPQEAAAHVLAMRLAGLAYAIPVGILQASMVRMGRLGDSAILAERRRVIASALLVSICVGSILFIVLCSTAYPLAEMFLGSQINTGSLVRTAATLLIILAVIELIEPIGTASAGLLRGCKDTRIPMIYSLIGNWGVTLPIGLILSLGFDAGVIGIWIGMGIGNITASLMLASRVKRHWNQP